jgi:hypothetical protein
MKSCRSYKVVLVDCNVSASLRGDCEGDIRKGVEDLVRSGVGGIEGRVEVHVREQMAHVGDEHLVLRLA